MESRILYIIFAGLMTSLITHGGDVCEPSWNLYEDMCFKIFDGSIVQAETEEHCNSVGARIMTVLTPRLKEFLVIHTEANTHSSYWCSTVSGEIDSRLFPNISTVPPPSVITTPKTVTPTTKTVTPTTKTVTPTTKTVTLTTNTGTSCCYLQDKELHLGDCNVPRGFICEKDSTVPAATCPENTEKIGTNCFWRTSDLLNKTKAAETCSEQDGWLANLETRRERTYAIATVSLRGKNLWVDGSKQGRKIKWKNGKSLDPEQDKTYIPIKDEGGDCVILGLSNVSETGASWIFGDCSRTAYGLCEKEAVLTPITVQPTTSIPETTLAPECPGRGGNDREKDGMCYWETRYETPRFDWETARTFCQSYGGDLASYKDGPDEERSLGDGKGHFGGLWIGLRREPHSNVFRWSDGSTLTYTNWAPGEPKLKGNLKHCVAHIGENSTWEVTYCWVHRWFVCKIPKDKIPSNPVPPTSEPVSECTRFESNRLNYWQYYRGYCYSLYRFRVFSWHTAKTFCQDNGAFLASLHSFDDIRFLFRVSPYYGSEKNFWIGLRAKGLHSPYRWDDGTPLDFVNWEEDDPYDDTSSIDTCVAFNITDGFWKKAHCNHLGYAICQVRDETNHTFPTPTPTSVLPGYCPDGWYTFGNKCYRVFGKKHKRIWSEASRSCAEIGSQLVSIHSQEEQDFLALLVLAVEHDTWIGMYSTIGGRLFHWTDNSSLDYTNWYIGEPSYAYEQEECVHIVFNSMKIKMGTWNDHRCTMTFPFICQIPKDPMLTKPGRDGFRCSNPEGWFKIGSSCYQIFNESDNSLTWIQAQTFCMSVSGSLASIKNSVATAYLRYHLTGSTGFFWIGMRDTTEHNYRWIESSRTEIYTNWINGQPQAVSPLHNCVAMNAEGTWMVRSCDESLPFICEESKEPPTIAPPEPDLVCPEATKEWKDFGGKFCYFIEISKNTSWYMAASYCFQQGGNLASLHSEYEMEAVLHRLKDSKMPVHIGFGQKEDGGFGWIDGSAVDYVHWAPGEPNSASEMCVEMHTDVGTWNDISCESKRGYVCSTRKVPRNLSTTDGLTDKAKDLEARLNAGGIVGIIVCVLVVLIIAAVALYYTCPSTRMRAWRQSVRSQL